MTRSRKSLDELLVAEATDRLSDAERAELEALLAEHPDVDRHAFERAAAAVFLAVGAAQSEPLPASLGAKLARAAGQLLGRD